MRTTTSKTAPRHKKEREVVEPATEAEAKAKAKETTQVVEDGPHKVEVEVAEADQPEGHKNKTCDEYHRKETGKLHTRNYKTMRILCRPILADLAKCG